MRKFPANLVQDGIFTNYLLSSGGVFQDINLANLAHLLTKSHIQTVFNFKNRTTSLEKISKLVSVFTYFNFVKEGKNRLEYTTVVNSLRYKKKVSSDIFEQMRNSLPPINQIFQTRLIYRLNFDYLYQLIQPAVQRNFLTHKEKEVMKDCILIMIDNGITLLPNTSALPIKNSLGETFCPNFSPNFEEFLIYRVKNFCKN